MARCHGYVSSCADNATRRCTTGRRQERKIQPTAKLWKQYIYYCCINARVTIFQTSAFFCCCPYVTEWVSVYGFTLHSTHNRSFWRWVFPGNWLHWYWQPNTMKQNATYTRNTKETQKKSHSYTIIWYAFHSWPPTRKWSGPCAYSPEAHTGHCTDVTGVFKATVIWGKYFKHQHFLLLSIHDRVSERVGFNVTLDTL